MLSLTDWCWALGGFRSPHGGRDAAEYDAEPAEMRPDGVKVQRLLELQDELHQLERLPGTLAGMLAAGAGEPLVGLTPAWQERVMAIEAEMESLRDELSREATEREAVSPHASEAIGQRILQQIQSRERGQVLRTRRLVDPWPEADSGRVCVDTDGAS